MGHPQPVTAQPDGHVYGLFVENGVEEARVLVLPQRGREPIVNVWPKICCPPAKP